MRTRFWRQRTNIISATLTLIAALLLTGCFGNDEEDWNGKNISGLMPELEFDLINSQGKSVSGDESVIIFVSPSWYLSTMEEASGSATRSMPAW